MSLRRRLATAVGLVLAGIAFAMVFLPGLAAQLATQRSVLVAIGIAAVFQAYRVVQSRRRTEMEIAETGDPETEQDLPVPGDEFDEVLANMHGLRNPKVAARERRTHIVRGRDQLTQRLEAAAVATITRKYGCTEGEAQAILDAGSWTEDPFAAAFFTGTVRGIGFGTRVKMALSGQGRFERQATAAARAIAALAESDDARLPDVEAATREVGPA